VKAVVLVGGTHGNERHGPALVQEFANLKESGVIAAKYPSFDLQLLVANTKACAAIGTGAGLRYVDVDLNRCFLASDLDSCADTTSYERIRAAEINLLLGPKAGASPAADFIIDLHSTTANTGILVCCHPLDTFSLQLVAHLQTFMPHVSLALWSRGDVAMLPSIGRAGLTLEIGAIPHSTCHAGLYQQTKAVVHAILDYISLHNDYIIGGATVPQIERRTLSLRAFRGVGSLAYPRDPVSGTITAFVHPRLQGCPELASSTGADSGDTILVANSPVFQRLEDAADILLRDVIDLMKFSSAEDQEKVVGDIAAGVSQLYPLFINEAAYYEADKAMALTLETILSVTDVCVKI